MNAVAGLTLALALANVEGIVEDPQGAPLKGALVRAWKSGSEAWAGWESERTDEKGRFSLAAFGADPVTVRADSVGLAGVTIEKARAGTSLRLRLSAGATVEGTVLDAGSGRPISGAQVLAVRGETPTSGWDVEVYGSTSTTDTTGHFRLTGVESGFISVIARAKGYGTQVRMIHDPRRPLRLMLLPGGSITGTVSDLSGRPVADAVARMEPAASNAFLGDNPLPVSRPVPTDSKGRYSFFGVDSGVYRVVARHPAFGLGASEAVEMQGGDDAFADVALSPGATLVGRMVSNDGKPAAGTAFVADWNGAPVGAVMGETLRARGHADGMFRIEGVPVGVYTIVARAPGAGQGRIDVTILPKDAQRNVGDIVLERGLEIGGIVRDPNERAIGGAAVRAVPIRAGTSPESLVEAASGPDGRFVIVGLEAGPHMVMVEAEGHGGDQRMAEAGTTNVEFVLSATGSVSGTVLDEAGRPVDLFQVELHPEIEGDGVRIGHGSKRVTDPSGRFLISEIGPGTYTIRAEAPERAASATSGVIVKAGGVTDVGVVRLSRGGVVRGTVVDGDDRPVVDANVFVGPNARSLAAFFGSGAGVFTDPSGTFELRGVPEGKTDIVVRHRDFAPKRATGVDVGAETAELRIVLDLGGRIEGTARGGSGRGFESASVVLDEGVGDSTTQKVQADGSFAFPHVLPGSHGLTLFSSRSVPPASQYLQVEVREGEVTRVSFDSRDIRVSGLVTLGGRPLPGATVALEGQPFYTGPLGIAPDAVAEAPRRGEATTREDGSYELLARAAGDTYVTVTGSSFSVMYGSRSVSIPDAESFVLDIAFEGTPIRGVVVDADDESPIAEASVSVERHRADHNSSVSTDKEGRFEVIVEPGEVVLNTYHHGHGPDSREISVQGGGPLEVRIVLSKGLAITGRVVDERRQPVPYAKVMAGFRSPEGIEYAMGGGTSLNGSFRLVGLKEGSYEVTVLDGNGLFGRVRDVQAGTENMVIVAERGGEVKIQLFGVAPAFVRTVSVMVASVDGEPAMGGYGGEASTDGVVEMTVPRGMVRLLARLGRLVGETTVLVTSGGSAKAEIRLAPSTDANSR